MMTFFAIKYYFFSIISLIQNFNFWVFPLLLIKKPLLIKIDGHGNYYVSNFMDIWTLKETLIDKQYEQYQKIKKNDLVFDIGAAIGDFSISASKMAKKVIVYECDAERLMLMKKNIRLNESQNVLINHEKAQSLNKIIDGFSKVDFLKIDCEGCEYQIFQNASQETLNKIKYLAMEAHLFDSKMKKNFVKLSKKLMNSGFQLKIVSNCVHDNICYVFAQKT